MTSRQTLRRLKRYLQQAEDRLKEHDVELPEGSANDMEYSYGVYESLGERRAMVSDILYLEYEIAKLNHKIADESEAAMYPGPIPQNVPGKLIKMTDVPDSVPEESR